MAVTGTWLICCYTELSRPDLSSLMKGLGVLSLSCNTCLACLDGVRTYWLIGCGLFKLLIQLEAEACPEADSPQHSQGICTPIVCHYEPALWIKRCTCASAPCLLTSYRQSCNCQAAQDLPCPCPWQNIGGPCSKSFVSQPSHRLSLSQGLNCQLPELRLAAQIELPV